MVSDQYFIVVGGVKHVFLWYVVGITIIHNTYRPRWKN